MNELLPSIVQPNKHSVLLRRFFLIAIYFVIILCIDIRVLERGAASLSAVILLLRLGV